MNTIVINKTISQASLTYEEMVRITKTSIAKEQLIKKGNGGSTMSNSSKTEWRARFSDGSTYTFSVEPGENAYCIAGEMARESSLKVVEVICVSK